MIGGDYLLQFYNNPPPVPEKTKQKLDQYSRGMNWEYFWSETCFLVLSKMVSSKNVDKLIEIIKEGHIWYADHALTALVEYKPFFTNPENIRFIKSELNKRDSFAAVVPLEILGKIQGNDFITEMIIGEIEHSIKSPSPMSHLRAVYLIQKTSVNNRTIKEKYVNYLIDVVESDNIALQQKYYPHFQFEEMFKANVLKYLKLHESQNQRVINLLEEWRNTDMPEEIAEILFNNYNNNIEK